MRRVEQEGAAGSWLLEAVMRVKARALSSPAVARIVSFLERWIAVRLLMLF